MKTRIPSAFVAVSIVSLGLIGRAAAQVAPDPPPTTGTLVQIAGPASGYPNEHVVFCFTKVKPRYTPENPVDVGHSQVPEKPDSATLVIIDAFTGAEKAKKQITLPVAGSPALPSDPCVEYVVPASVASSTIGFVEVTAIASPQMLIGVVSVSSEPVPPAAVTSSLEIFTPGPFGIPLNIRHIPPIVTCPSGETPCVY